MSEVLDELVEDAVRKAVLDAADRRAYQRYYGEYCEQLIGELEQLLHPAKAMLASSGTAALEIGLRGLGIGQGDRVLLSAYDYPGNAWAIERVGARPVLVDVQRWDWSLDLEKLEAAIRTIPGCRALVVSHLHGAVQPVAELLQLCTRHGIVLIEDCCQAIGAREGGRALGTWGALTTLSFGGGKLLSAGRGGALICNDPALMQRCRIAAGAGSGPYAMSELQAAVVLAQWPFLNDINQTSRRFFGQLAESVTREAHAGPCRCHFPYATASQAAFYQAGMILEVPGQGATKSQGGSNLRDELINALRNVGVPAGPGFDGLFRRSQRRCDKPVSLGAAIEVAANTIVVHHHAAIAGKIAPTDLAGFISRFLR